MPSSNIEDACCGGKSGCIHRTLATSGSTTSSGTSTPPSFASGVPVALSPFSIGTGQQVQQRSIAPSPMMKPEDQMTSTAAATQQVHKKTRKTHVKTNQHVQPHYDQRIMGAGMASSLGSPQFNLPHQPHSPSHNMWSSHSTAQSSPTATGGGPHAVSPSMFWTPIQRVHQLNEFLSNTCDYGNPLFWNLFMSEFFTDSGGTFTIIFPHMDFTYDPSTSTLKDAAPSGSGEDSCFILTRDQMPELLSLFASKCGLTSLGNLYTKVSESFLTSSNQSNPELQGHSPIEDEFIRLAAAYKQADKVAIKNGDFVPTLTQHNFPPAHFLATQPQLLFESAYARTIFTVQPDNRCADVLGNVQFIFAPNAKIVRAQMRIVRVDSRVCIGHESNSNRPVIPLRILEYLLKNSLYIQRLSRMENDNGVSSAASSTDHLCMPAASLCQAVDPSQVSRQNTVGNFSECLDSQVLSALETGSFESYFALLPNDDQNDSINSRLQQTSNPDDFSSWNPSSAPRSQNNT